MSTKQKPLEEEIETPVETIPLNTFTLPNGSTCFVADRDDIVQYAQVASKEHGLGIYYIMALHNESEAKVANQAKDVEKFEPTLFKVINNMTSLAVHKVDNANLGLKPLEPHAFYQLPKIPWEMVNKLDYFFRQVDLKLGGSEAIVCLTFDDRFATSEGWGFVVPAQENSAGSCHYEPGSALEQIDDADFDHVHLVGTAHSHPHMKAYASHVDESDQFQNDGIHITFGWTNKETEFYIEMVVANVQWILKPDTLFDMPAAASFPEVDVFVDRVKKKVVAINSPAKPQLGATNNINSYDRKFSIPSSFPDTTKTTVVVEVHKNQYNCPVCYKVLTELMRQDRQCLECEAYYLLNGETLQEATAARRTKGRDVRDLEGSTKDERVWKWFRPGQSTNTTPILLLGPKAESTPKV